MKTIILCGGTGTRLKEETEYKPKPMVYVGNQPILWHIMKIYAAHGFNEFILALGYKANYIKEFFLNQKAFTNDFTLNTRNYETKYHIDVKVNLDKFKITFVDTGQDTLPGERILRCQKYIPKKDKHFMVTYGDGVTNLNISDLVKFHKKQKSIGTITGVHPKSKYGLVRVNEESYVDFFQEKPLLTDWINAGFMVFDKKVFNYIKTGETEHEALKRLAKEKELSLFKHTGFWYAVDTNKELEELNGLWNSKNPPWKVWEQN